MTCTRGTGGCGLGNELRNTPHSAFSPGDARVSGRANKPRWVWRGTAQAVFRDATSGATQLLHTQPTHLQRRAEHAVFLGSHRGLLLRGWSGRPQQRASLRHEPHELRREGSHGGALVGLVVGPLQPPHPAAAVRERKRLLLPLQKLRLGRVPATGSRSGSAACTRTVSCVS